MTICYRLNFKTKFNILVIWEGIGFMSKITFEIFMESSRFSIIHSNDYQLIGGFHICFGLNLVVLSFENLYCFGLLEVFELWFLLRIYLSLFDFSYSSVFFSIDLFLSPRINHFSYTSRFLSVFQLLKNIQKKNCVLNWTKSFCQIDKVF